MLFAYVHYRYTNAAYKSPAWYESSEDTEVQLHLPSTTPFPTKMASYLITGTSQGLGTSMVKYLASFPAAQISTVFATTRRDEPPTELADIIKASSGRVQHVKLDVESDESVNAAAAQIDGKIGTKGLDVLVNNAALTSQCPTPRIWEVDDLQSCFTTNVVAVHRVSKAFLPLLRKGQQKKIMNISSTQGSCGRAAWTHHVNASAPDYKVSKAAVNMLTIQWSISLADEGFTIQCISPGHLQTRLGTFGGKVNADLPPEDGAKSVIDTIEDSEPADNGRFRDIKVKGWHHRYAGKDALW